MESNTVITHTETPGTGHGSSHGTTKKSSPAVNALAIVGFLALIFIGIGLAIYSAQYVPMAVSKLGSGNNHIAVVPTTIPFSTSPATTTVMTSGVSMPQMPNVQTTSIPATTASAATGYTTATTPTESAPATQTLSGLPDLSTTIISTGYLANGASDNFASYVATPLIPVDSRAAVQFSIANVGTNATGPWNFIAQIPTDNGYVYTSPIEENLNPGDHILFTLGFDQVPPGTNEEIRIIADPNNQIPESNEVNNEAVGSITVVGS